MSKGLRSYPESMRRQVAERRARNNTRGLGYLGALDYISKVKPRKVKADGENNLGND